MIPLLNWKTVRGLRPLKVITLCIFVFVNVVAAGENAEEKEKNAVVIAIVPFREGASLQPAGDAICTLTGIHFTPGKVKRGAGLKLARMVYGYLDEKRDYKLISPDKTVRALSGTDFYITGKYNIPLALKLARILKVEYLVMGIVARYEEREGGSFFARSPASVAFSIALIKAPEGKIVWMGSFDKTQKSLMSDLFDPDIPVKKRFIWLTAEELAQIGVTKVMSSFPEIKEKR